MLVVRRRDDVVDVGSVGIWKLCTNVPVAGLVTSDDLADAMRR